MVKSFVKLALMMLAVVIFTTACSKLDYDNPEVEGNLVKAKIDGKDWVAKTQDYSGQAVIVTYDKDYFFFIAHNTVSGFNTNFDIRVNNVTGPGTYTLNNMEPGRAKWKNNNKIFTDSYFFSNEVENGTLTISEIDTKEKNVKGSFQFSAINSGGKKVEVTEGYFDVNY